MYNSRSAFNIFVLHSLKQKNITQLVAYKWKDLDFIEDLGFLMFT